MDVRGTAARTRAKMHIKFKQNLVISVIFLVAFGLRMAPWGVRWVMLHPRRVMLWDKSERLSR